MRIICTGLIIKSIPRQHFQNFSKQGVTEGTEIKNLTDSDVISVSKKITTLEMKELNERQRAEHAVRMYEQQKSILHDLETRNKDLEEKFAEVRKGILATAGVSGWGGGGGEVGSHQ